MISNFLHWILHWVGQGLKLWLFAAMASICTMPASLPLAFLEDANPDFEGVGPLPKAGYLAGTIFLVALSIAIFTAVLASQLRDHPLQPFAPKRRRKDETKPAEQGSDGKPDTVVS